MLDFFSSICTLQVIDALASNAKLFTELVLFLLKCRKLECTNTG